MATSMTLPQTFKIVDGSAGPVTSNGGVTCDYISMKHAHKVWIVVNAHQAVGHATTIQPRWATAVAGTSVANITNSVNWWLNADVSSTDTLAAQTAGTLGTFNVAATNQLMVIEIDPAAIIATAGDTFDCLGCVVADSSQATDFVQVTYIVDHRYPQTTPPTVITD